MLMFNGGFCKYLAAPVSFRLGRRVHLFQQPMYQSFVVQVCSNALVPRA